MPPTRTSETAQRWAWHGRRISMAEGGYPRMVYAAILALRDASTEEEHDMAEVLVWTIDEHPPWNGNCPTCGTPGACDSQLRGDVVGLEFLIRKSTQLMRRCASQPSRPALRLVRTEPEGA